MCCSISSERFEELAPQIQEIFKTEKSLIYYESSYTVNQNDPENKKIRRVNASGFLYSTYLRLRDTLRNNCVIQVVPKAPKKKKTKS